jgi:hypothetical protein
MYSTVAYSARISCFQSQQDGFEAPIFFKTVGTKVRGQFTPGEDKRYPTERPKYKGRSAIAQMMEQRPIVCRVLVVSVW